jgi:poly-gamma-glutamate synthesis protein (capsule biosynthesis protein)
VARLSALAVVALALVAVSGCTPEEYQRWWVERGNPALEEPELSEAAARATSFWDEAPRRHRFTVSVAVIDPATAARMTPSSWRPGCPVPLDDLRYLRLSYMDRNGAEAVGELVVHRDAVFAAAVAFKEMWDERFPITSMRLVDDFGGDDGASMAADNTSAFNCRRVSGSERFSEHAYGRAVDINPVENPSLSAGAVEPAAGAAYLDRGDVRAGMLVAGSVPVTTFDRLGWGWGGRWRSSLDYQHVSATGR